MYKFHGYSNIKISFILMPFRRNNNIHTIVFIFILFQTKQTSNKLLLLLLNFRLVVNSLSLFNYIISILSNNLIHI